MNVETDRRTNAVLVARSRSQRVGRHREQQILRAMTQLRSALDQPAVHLDRRRR